MPALRPLTLTLLIVAAATLQAEDLVANPDFAAWAKVPKGTLLTYSIQKVNVMDIPRIVTLEVSAVTDAEVVLSQAGKTENDRKILAKIPATVAPKDNAGDKKDDRKLKDGSSIASRMVIRKVAGQPDMKLWLSDDAPGGVVEREWEESKSGTIIEKLTAFTLPGKPKKEFVQPKPDPNSAHPIDPAPPERVKMDGGPTPAEK
jgi:hypothetical protein